MYKYAAADSILDGVSNIYLVSIATAFLAVILAFYCSNFLKDESDKQLKDISENDEEMEGGEDDYTESSDIKHGRVIQDYDECNSDQEEDSDSMNTTDGLVGKLKSKRVRELEARLTRDQLEEERRIEREQLSAIFELLKKQEAELNMKEIDENELNAQLSLYR